MPRRRTFAAMAGLVAFALAVGSWSPVSARSASGPVTLSGPISLSSVQWIFYKEDFNHLNDEDPALIEQIVASPATYVLEHSVGGHRLPPQVIPAEMFFSAAELQGAIDQGQVIPGVKVVIDDLENLPTTPTAELDAPIPAMKEFAQAAAVNGYQPVLVPGRDLMLVSGARCSKQPGLTISQAYLRCGLPAAAAYTPIYVIQAASVETNLTALQRLVRLAAARARKANPNVTIFATLSVSPNGADVPSSAVVQAAQVIRPYVQGFAMNNVRPSDPRMLDFLTQLSQG
jgi:hypothetical protein